MHPLKSMPGEKVPGVHGFPIEFFTSQWATIKGDVFQDVREFFHSGKILRSISYTTVTVIQKCDNPTKMKDY